MKNTIIAVVMVAVAGGLVWYFWSMREVPSGVYPLRVSPYEGAPASNQMPVPGPEGEGVEEMVVNDGGTPSVPDEGDDVPTPTPTPTPAPTPAPNPAPAVITYTDSGYSPSPLTVKKGTRVTFKNQSNVSFWPASAMHPTHTVYPNSGISKCNTSVEDSIFDACRGIAPGGSYSFTFNEVGSWGYHDHLSPGRFGKVIVE